MRKEPSRDVITVIWGIQAMVQKNLAELYNAERVLESLIAEDLQEKGESLKAIHKELDGHISDAIWGIGEDESIARRVEQTLEKIGHAADRFNKLKEAGSA